jgi:succinate-semialdehyde dehydrogenase/glutarate-semialdehyde dehydrogenase
MFHAFSFSIHGTRSKVFPVSCLFCFFHQGTPLRLVKRPPPFFSPSLLFLPLNFFFFCLGLDEKQKVAENIVRLSNTALCSNDFFPFYFISPIFPPFFVRDTVSEGKSKQVTLWMLRRSAPQMIFSFAETAYATSPTILSGAYNYFDGKFVSPSNTKQVLSVENPATHQSLGVVPNFGEAETEQAIKAAQQAFPGWANVLPRERAVLLRKWSDLMMKHQENLAAIITRESGKPLTEALGENTYSARYVEWYAGEAERVYGDIIGGPRHNVRTTVTKQPVGVVGIITPWNFPSAMITRAAAAALAAGCTVVVKPSELTPFSALALAQLAHEAGIPRGVFNIVTGDAAAIGKTLTSSFDVRKISFTGSTRTGKLLMKDSCDTVKKLAMELGGNAPCIVFRDADIDRAVEGIMMSKFRNAGQTCICTNRLFIHESIFEVVVEKVLAKIAALKIGNGLEKGVSFGPVINRQAVDRIEGLVRDAVAAGAVVRCGGSRVTGPGNFFMPTLLTNVSHGMAVCQSEIFGPILPALSFSDDEKVIELANSTRAGLASYFFTEDYKKQWKVSDKLRFGMVGINDGIISATNAPFGGVKESGLGRDGSKYGIEAFVDIKYVLHSNL